MAIKRFIIEIGFETEYPMATVEGKPGKTMYLAHACWKKEEAERFAAERAERFGGKVVGVKPETRTHNIPALEPEAWKRLTEKMARETAKLGHF